MLLQVSIVIKDHLREFLKGSLKELMKDDYIGDLVY